MLIFGEQAFFNGIACGDRLSAVLARRTNAVDTKCATIPAYTHCKPFRIFIYMHTNHPKRIDDCLFSLTRSWLSLLPLRLLCLLPFIYYLLSSHKRLSGGFGSKRRREWKRLWNVYIKTLLYTFFLYIVALYKILYFEDMKQFSINLEQKMFKL